MMVVIGRQFYHVCGSNKVLLLTKADLARGAKPLVWFNNGLWGVISKEKIVNMIANMQDQANLPVLDRKKDVGKFYWDECEIIPSKLAKILFGETK